MRHIVICTTQFISITSDTGQLRVLTKFTTAPFMTYVPFDVLVGLEESLDLTSLSQKTNNPSRSHCHISQR